MKVISKFLKSAVAPEHFPVERVPEVAFLGRSNVGKSSLINALLGSKHAHVSSTPGRTRTINFFGIFRNTSHAKPEFLLADLPGYGYAKISRSISAEWPKFIEPYLQDRGALALAVCLVDSNVPAQESDAQLISWLQHHRRNYVVVATKCDKLSGNKLTNSLRALQRDLQTDNILPCSAKTLAGLPALWKHMHTTVAEYVDVSRPVQSSSRND